MKPTEGPRASAETTAATLADVTSKSSPPVLEPPRQPAADLHGVDPSRRIALKGQGPIAWRRVVQRAGAGERPDVSAYGFEQLHPPLAQKTGEASIERAASVHDGKRRIQLVAAIEAGGVQSEGGAAHVEGGQANALIVLGAIHPNAVQGAMEAHGAARRRTVRLQLQSLRRMAKAQPHVLRRRPIDADAEAGFGVEIGAEPLGVRLGRRRGRPTGG